MTKGSRDKPQDGTPHNGGGIKRRDLLLRGGSLAAASALSATGLKRTALAQQQAQKQAARPGQRPNILFIMGDDIGWMQPSIYHRGLMVGETPN
ncbi:MAG: arylsulfatase, partial [Hyphomicrobiaceae bacterium]